MDNLLLAAKNLLDACWNEFGAFDDESVWTEGDHFDNAVFRLYRMVAVADPDYQPKMCNPGGTSADQTGDKA